MRSLLTIVYIFTFTTSIFSQIDFIQANHLIADQKIRSTLSIGISDLNDDYKDDIVLLDQGTDLITGFQSGQGKAFIMEEHGSILDNPAWALSLGDLDNDGISEIFACGINTFGQIYRRTDDGGYAFQQLLFGMTFPQNSNFADINNDGWLDVFVCDERAYNDLFLNDGTGNMVYNDYIDMYTVPASDNSGNYGSEWVDFDDDRDLDLFITKCKPGIESPEDPLRVNVLFENDGLQQYSENAQKYGLKNGSQSWTGSFGDLDNDGDLDCFVSNHDTTHVVYENINNDTFIDVTEQWMQALRSSSIQAAIRDFDNNGYMDVYVSGDIDYMLWNNGDNSFTTDENPLGILNVFTFATGDLNDDGFLDIIASHGLLNMPGDYDDIVWQNSANDNHFLKISFLGEESNRKGVGAKVKLYSDLGIQVRDVKIGESYGTTNSGNVHFGLAEITEIDSLHIYWPSGIKDVYNEVPVDAHLLAHEGKCISRFIDIQHDGDAILCEGESIELSVSRSFENYIWSTGELTPTITLHNEAEVYFKGVDEQGCVHASNIKTIEYEPYETPDITIIEDGEVFCDGEEVHLISTKAEAYLWTTGETGQEIIVTQTGSYGLEVNGKCDVFQGQAVYIEFFDVAEPILPVDTIFLEEPEVLVLNAEGSEIYWYADATSDNILSIGQLETGLIGQDTTFYAAALGQHNAEIQRVGMTDHLGTPLGGSNLNSGLLFNAFSEFTLEYVSVITDVAGIRTIELRQLDENTGEEMMKIAKSVMIEPGEQVIELGFLIEPGLQYVLTTNVDSNLLYVGSKSPALYRSNVGVAFPYKIDDIVEIISSLHGPSYYYYFFDWQIRPASISCFSERVPQHIVMDTITIDVDEPIQKPGLLVYPNPAENIVFIDVTNSTIDDMNNRVVILDLTGRILWEFELDENMKFSSGKLPPGMYYVHMINSQGMLIDQRKIIILGKK